jgi:hypothetical protein
MWLETIKEIANDGEESIQAPEEERPIEASREEKNPEDLHSIEIITKEAYQGLSVEEKEAYNKAIKEKLSGKVFWITRHGKTTPGWKVISYSGMLKKIVVERYDESGAFLEAAEVVAPQISLSDQSVTIPSQPETEHVSAEKDSEHKEPVLIEEKDNPAIEEQPDNIDIDTLAKENKKLKNRLATLEEQVNRLMQPHRRKAMAKYSEDLDRDFANIDDVRPEFRIGDQVDIGDSVDEKGWVVKKISPAGGGTVVVGKEGALKYVEPTQVKPTTIAEPIAKVEEADNLSEINIEKIPVEPAVELKNELAAERNMFAEKIRLANKRNPAAARQVIAVEQAVEKALEEAVRSNEPEKYEKIKSDLKELYTDPRTFLSDQDKIKKYGFS